MGKPRAPQPVVLVCGLISGDDGFLQRARADLKRLFGPIDLASETWPFELTDYYSAEMGPGLLRQFVSFERLLRPDALASVKLDTQRIETRFAEDCESLEIARPINLDPGYVETSKLVLATTKDRSHRVYLGDGIYGESTLHYHEHAWQPWPWTFPDFRERRYHEFFSRVRQRLLDLRRAGRDTDAGA